MKLAYRNLLSHHLRSFVSIIMIGMAVFSILLFSGFAHFFTEGIKSYSSEIQYGNIQIAKEKFWSPGKENRADRIFQLSDIEKMNFNKKDLVKYSGRLSFSGLLSNSEDSVGAYFIGFDSDKELDFSKSIRIDDGRFFDSNKMELIIGKPLAEKMGIKAGGDATIMSLTLDGVMNAIDVKAIGIFSSGMDEIDSKIIYVPIKLAQEILNTDMVDLAVIKLNSVENSEQNASMMNDYFKSNKIDLKAKSWKDLAGLYRQVEKFYAVQNRVVEIILNVLVFFGILNTVSMSIVERTGEIGILRSLGENRSSLTLLYMLESFLLVICGTALGILLSFIAAELISYFQISIELPLSTEPMRVHVSLSFFSILYASILVFVTTMAATFIPVKRALKMNITEALRQNI